MRTEGAGVGVLMEFGPGISITSTSLEVDESVSFNELVGYIEDVVGSVNASAWYIGALLNAARRFHGRYPDGVERLELKYATLYNHARVERKVPPENRYDALTWTHHRVVSALSHAEQKLWLEDALRHGWTVAELESEIAATRPAATAALPAPTVKLALDAARAARWSSYADQHGMTVDQLVTVATDQYVEASA